MLCVLQGGKKLILILITSPIPWRHNKYIPSKPFILSVTPIAASPEDKVPSQREDFHPFVYASHE
jgi:hypothetical protein